MPLTKVPESLSRSVRRKRSLLQAMRQWLGETPASSMQIELEEFRPMDRIPSTWNSAFLNGPLNAASLGCTDRVLTSVLLRRQTGLLGRRYSSANHGCSPSQTSNRMDSVPIQVVRFMGGRRVCPNPWCEIGTICFLFC